MKIKDRIVGLRRVRACDLLPNPKNWRTHPEQQQNAMRGILAEVGIADAMLARETPDGLMLIDGHLRADVSPDTEWPVLVLDVTESEADKILATHDPLASMAGADPAQLDALLREIETGSEELAQMLEGLAADAGVILKESSNPQSGDLQTLPTQRPPVMSWVLVGVPTVRFGTISQLIEQIAAVDDAIVETTVTDG